MNKKITQLPAAALCNSTQLLPIVNDPLGSPETQKATLQQLFDSIASLAAAAGVTNDQLIIVIDDPAGTPTAKYVTISNLAAAIGGGGGGTPAYRAILSQTGTDDPVVVAVLQNNLSGPIVWTRDDVGTYLGTLIGAFPENKVFSLAGQRNGGGEIEINRINDDSVYIETRGFDGGAIPPQFILTDGILQLTSVEILVYP